jgi:uncharacterized protein
MSNAIIERRYVSSFQLRSFMQSGKRCMSGYAATFNTPWSKQLTRQTGIKESIAPGAFSRAIKQQQDCICTRDHNPSLIMGRVSNGTLRLREDRKGLFFECDMPQTQAADDLHELIKRGDVKACSFSFISSPAGEKWGQEKNDKGNLQATRTLTDVDLMDVSPVSTPAYDIGTEVNSREEKDEDDDDLEDFEENSLQEVERNSFIHALFPTGHIPVEVRSHMQLRRRKSGIVTVRERMKMRLELSSRL